MRIQTELLKEASLTFEFEAPADRFPALRELMAGGECGFAAPVRVRLKAVRLGALVEVEGTLATAVRHTCGRCLAEFVAPLDTAFACTYSQQPAADDPPLAADGDRAAADEAGLIYFRGEEIDLTADIQEQVMVSLPLRPLCHEACRGLCVRCGADLNQGDCGCIGRPVEGPFAALRHLKLEKH